MKRKRGTTRDMMVTPAPPTWEVVRVHPATGRSQLHAWGWETEAEAQADVDSMHREMDRQDGLTDAQGKLEAGWVYRKRSSGGGC
jgi:hypothetical protein